MPDDAVIAVAGGVARLARDRKALRSLRTGARSSVARQRRCDRRTRAKPNEGRRLPGCYRRPRTRGSTSFRCSAITAAPATTSSSSRLTSALCSTCVGRPRQTVNAARTAHEAAPGDGATTVEPEETSMRSKRLRLPSRDSCAMAVTQRGVPPLRAPWRPRHACALLSAQSRIPRSSPTTSGGAESDLVGVDMNDDEQLHLVSEIFPQFRDEYEALPIGPD